MTSMKHPPRQQAGPGTANVKIDGKEMTINIQTGGANKTAGPMHLSGDERLPDGVARVKTQQELYAQNAPAARASFSNPSENIRHTGIQEGMHVADFGSGAGAYVMALADAVGKDGMVYAVDVQRDLLTRVQNDATQAGHENVEIVWGDIEEPGGVNIKEGLLDAVLISNTLFQAENKNGVIKEAWRVLKPGGMLVVIDWTDSFGGIGPQQNMVVTQAEATLICTDNNFALKKNIDAGSHHYGLVFVKMVEGQTSEQALAQAHEKEDDFVSKTIAQELI